MKMSRFAARSANPASRSRGFALVITLAVLVLVTFVVMAFFSRATSTRRLEATRTSSLAVDQLARSAQSHVLGALIAEIDAHSKRISANGTTTYFPSAPMYAVPQRTVPASAPFTTSEFTNLIRRSVNETRNGAGETSASTHNTATPSRNGRIVAPGRWNAPRLLSGNGFTTAEQSPNWIYFNQDGTVTATPSANSKGRFAYNLYDIGGLLDVSVAGYPFSVSGDDLKKIKHTLSGADLSLIPGMASPASFLTWRNAPSLAQPSDYLTMVDAFSKESFLQQSPGNHVAQSRQDLIRLASLGTTGISDAALPYLTTFSRTWEGPGHVPDPDRAKVRTQAPQSPQFGLDDHFNPPLMQPQVLTAFTRADGSEAQENEPLLKKRFPLERITLLEAAPANVSSGSDIHRFFGLTRSSGSPVWTYSHGAADRILSLDEVAALGREPDFFEVLQACIPVGSLGKSAGRNQAYNLPGWNNASSDVARDSFSKYQILQIGANIIDQWDADSFPTVIRLDDANRFEFAGIENLPYLVRIFSSIFKQMQTNPSNPSGPPVEYLHYFLHPEIWNPHQDTPTSGVVPSQLRFVIDGSFTLTNDGSNFPGKTLSASGSRGLLFPNSNVSFREPQLLDLVATATDSGDQRIFSSSGQSFVGYHMGEFYPWGGNWASNTIVPSTLSYHLQFLSGSQWVTYSTMRAHSSPIFMANPHAVATGQYPHPIRYWIARSDPRVERFGYLLRYEDADPGTKSGSTLRPSIGDSGVALWWHWLYADPPRYPGWTLSEAYPWYYYYYGLLPENRPGSNTFYADPDGVVRMGDSAFASGNIGQPMSTSNTTSRPIVLNRPFRSVAEMGYACRDMPWKTLDFFTPDAADGALLEAFCLRATDAGEISAGKLNLNMAREPVLAAVLRAASKSETDEITLAQANAVASRIRAITALTPLENLAAIGPRLTSDAVIGAALGSVPDAALKFRRESVTRALADVGQVRAWNVLADVMAQVGRFSAAGPFGPSDFTVDSEQRNWHSIAIDRPTANTIQIQEETIHE